MYRKGLSLRSIAEIIGTSNVLILHWIRNMGRFVQETVLSRPFSSSEEMDIIEIDEMWHYVQKNAKKYGNLQAAKLKVVIKNLRLLLHLR